MSLATDRLQFREQAPDLADEVLALNNLEAILNWFPRVGISLVAIDLIQQDEYCHDLLVPLPHDRRWIVFGLT